MFRTALCDLLGIEYPIVQGGMVWVSYHELCAAVSEAGGLGILAGGSIVKQDSEGLIRVAVEEGVSAISTSAGNPARFTAGIQAAGIKVMHVSPSAKLAAKAADAGVDAVVAEGIEAGGHDGFEEITTMALVPQVVDKLDIPVVAAGGIADSRGFVAALALGAQGVQIGTRFAATHEAMGHENFKRAILNAADTSTVITGRAMGPTRCIRNRLTQQILEAESKGATSEELFKLIGLGRSRRAAVEGDVEEGTIYCGQIAGLVGDLRSVRDVIQEILSGAERLIRHLGESVER
jgi:enoyl-[acyl-carrier protein] reductase II